MRSIRHVRRPWALVTAVSLASTTLASVAVVSAATAAAAQTGTPAPIQYTTSAVTFTSTATVNFSAVAGTTPPSGSSSSPTGSPEKKLGRPHPTGNRGTPITAGNNFVVRGNVAGETGFTGVTSPESAAVNIPPAGITPFSDVAPPDQATCTGPDSSGNPISFDFVNDAAAAYTTSGSVAWPVTPAWAMFGLPDSAFLSDPRCYYDASTQRWFFTMFTVGSPAPSDQYIAVSQTSDPLGSYTVFGFDTTDANNPLGDCPCFGDFDMIGADANGFYITTNEFSNISNPAGTPFYNGTVLYAVSKQQLEASATAAGTSAPSIHRYQITADPFGYSADATGSTPAQNNGPYHLSPALTPPGGTYAPGTEYFVESNSNLLSDNHLIVYALNDTSQLNAGAPPTLTATELTTEPYAFPPNAIQKNGPLPLGSTFGYHQSAPDLETDFNAAQETTYSAGQLYTELDTATVTSSDSGHAGVAWFDLAPTAPTTASPQVTASVANQGYVATSDSLLYPDMILDGSGNGYLDFSMSGQSDYPSAGYVAVTGGVPGGPIHLAAAGTAPEDDFTCYPPFATPAVGCRWGDYSGGAVWDGRVYMMAEYIPPTTRDTESNWGTFVWSAPVP